MVFIKTQKRGAPKYAGSIVEKYLPKKGKLIKKTWKPTQLPQQDKLKPHSQ